MKHDWFRYVDGTPRLNRQGALECKRCGVVFMGFLFPDADATECLQPELDGLQDITPTDNPTKTPTSDSLAPDVR
jgi:hypothetical protein